MSSSSPAHDTRALGAVLAGKYEVKRLIGRGGMGAVYEGVHREIGKRVAIKLLEAEHSRAEEVAARFRREGRAASRIESEHVVQVFDVGEDPTFGLYMVMEFLVGEDLAARLEREKLLDVAVALDIAWQTARGLAKAHAAGVIHRDLKPGNIFLGRRDDGSTVVKLVDFGISKLVVDGVIGPPSGEEGAAQPITHHGAAVGTPQYMSPEQAQGHAVDHRADLWALGAVLYEMLAGRPAYHLLENYEQTIFAIVLRKPPALADVAPWVPQPVAEVVERALEHDLQRRWPDGSAFARTLAEVAQLPELVARPSHLPEPPIALTRKSSGEGGSPPVTDEGLEVQSGAHASLGSRPSKASGSRKLVIAAVLALGGVAAAAGFVMLRGPEPPPRVDAAVAEVAAPPTMGAAPTVEVPPPVAPASVPAPSASVAPLASASVAPSALGVPIPTRPSAGAVPGPSGVARPQDAATPGGEQFGGTGVSTSF